MLWYKDNYCKKFRESIIVTHEWSEGRRIIHEKNVDAGFSSFDDRSV